MRHHNHSKFLNAAITIAFIVFCIWAFSAIVGIGLGLIGVAFGLVGTILGFLFSTEGIILSGIIVTAYLVTRDKKPSYRSDYYY